MEISARERSEIEDKYKWDLSIVYKSIDEWEKDFKSTLAVRGVGWGVLYLDIESGQLLNIFVEEHDKGHLCEGIPILVIDVWEHAYMLDFGTKRPDYINCIMDSLDWDIISGRYECQASNISIGEK
jgi:Fe-Mn family superoxide dismutase